MNNRQARIKRLKAVFERCQQLMTEGYSVLWDGDEVTEIDFDGGIELLHGVFSRTGIYEDEDKYYDMASLPVKEIAAELKERLTVWKKVEIKF